MGLVDVCDSSARIPRPGGACLASGSMRLFSSWGGERTRMAEIIQFRSKADIAEESGDVDIFTAVDVAIRDLRDIAARCGEESARLQAEECRQMLQRAFDAGL
jgi:hypothetical protein